MKSLFAFIAALSFVAATPVPQAPKTYVGFIGDTMCKVDHKAMGATDNAKCVRDCVGDGKTYKYALIVGKDAYTLSDQETPAKFAGRKVKVTGVLYAKTNILKVDRIEATN
jgi:hypothetical protein